MAYLLYEEQCQLDYIQRLDKFENGCSSVGETKHQLKLGTCVSAVVKCQQRSSGCLITN